jgi:hypothetical protein
MSDGVSDEFLEHAVQMLLDVAQRAPTLAEADEALMVSRAQLAEKIRALRKEGQPPELVASFERLLGRLHDATESGGR